MRRYKSRVRKTYTRWARQMCAQRLQQNLLVAMRSCMCNAIQEWERMHDTRETNFNKIPLGIIIVICTIILVAGNLLFKKKKTNIYFHMRRRWWYSWPTQKKLFATFVHAACWCSVFGNFFFTILAVFYFIFLLFLSLAFVALFSCTHVRVWAQSDVSACVPNAGRWLLCRQRNESRKYFLIYSVSMLFLLFSLLWRFTAAVVNVVVVDVGHFS